MNDLVMLTIRVGRFGERTMEAAVPIAEDLTRELMEPVELSDEPFSLLLASPGLYGGRGNAIDIRRKTFAMRRSVAHLIAKAMEDKLVELFGEADKTDGYTKQQLAR